MNPDQSTFVFFKELNTDTEVRFDITPLLRFGETLVSITASAPTPDSLIPLTLTIDSGIEPVVMATLKGGAANISYGVPITITTSARVLAALVAVTVQSIDQLQTPYTVEDPESYNDLVDTIEAGNAAIGTAVFQFPPNVDPAGGYVNWELFDAEGTVYASGNAFSFDIQSNGISNVIFARSVIAVPSSVPPSPMNQKYQLRYTLTLNGGDSDQQIYYSSESITVVGLNTVPLGTQSTVELKGDDATLSLVTEQLYENVYVELYSGNTKIAETRIPGYERVANGYYYAGTFSTTKLGASIVPYSVIWKYWNGNQTPFRENAALWVVTPSIMQAVDDVKAKINKARTTLYGTPDLLFPITTIMTWLRRGADNFNNFAGLFSSFTMTNALGGVREYWLMFAELLALESQYLAEGEKAFNFAGAAISLDVDRTQYLDSAASKIQSRIDNELRDFKKNLIIKGQTKGDGSADVSKLAQGAIGAVGITITPATPWGRYPGSRGF